MIKAKLFNYLTLIFAVATLTNTFYILFITKTKSILPLLLLLVTVILYFISNYINNSYVRDKIKIKDKAREKFIEK